MTSILGYASAMEVIQLLIACAGLALAMWGTWVSIEDTIELVDTPVDDWRRLIAKGNMRGQLARMSAQGVLTYAGIVSVLLPPPYGSGPDTAPELLQSALVRTGLILVTTILTLDMFFERKQRIDFMKKTRADAVILDKRHEEVLARVDVGIEASHAAEKEANTVNAKIAGLGEAILREQRERKTK